VFRQRGLVGLAVRRVRSEIPTFEELRLPEVMRTLADSPRGLVLITGPTGTGKTTTIASMIGYINRSRRAHIMTIEDPIEVVHDDEMSIIQQREIGLDTDSYEAALRHVVRQDPDVIFVGEIRDAESALSAIQAAETGHLVISTLHTIDCMETINRVLDLFPPQQAEGGADVVRRRAAGDRVATARAEGRREGARAGRGGPRQHRPRLRPARRSGADRLDRRRDRRRWRYYGMQSFDQALVMLVKDGLVGPTRRGVRRRVRTTSTCSCRACLDRGSAFSDDQRAGLPF
jgi:twitching motility protein PilT